MIFISLVQFRRQLILIYLFLGTIFILVCNVRFINYHFTKQHHFGIEAAIWYWRLKIYLCFLFFLVKKFDKQFYFLNKTGLKFIILFIVKLILNIKENIFKCKVNLLSQSYFNYVSWICLKKIIYQNIIKCCLFDKVFNNLLSKSKIIVRYLSIKLLTAEVCYLHNARNQTEILFKKIYSKLIKASIKIRNILSVDKCIRVFFQYNINIYNYKFKKNLSNIYFILVDPHFLLYAYFSLRVISGIICWFVIG